jgi:hypothetical protein
VSRRMGFVMAGAVLLVGGRVELQAPQPAFRAAIERLSVHRKPVESRWKGGGRELGPDNVAMRKARTAMNTQRRILVAVIGLFAFLTTSATGALASGTDDMHWKGTPPPGVTADGTQYVASCTSNCDDDMHW